MKLNCIIIDDEPLARKGLKEYVEDSGCLNLVAEFEDPLKAMDIAGSQAIHLIFLDIEMPKLTGLAFLKSLPNPPLVIFTTAYPQFAIDGFDLNAVDYLVKPFSFDRFLKAVMRARVVVESGTRSEEISPAATDHFFVKCDSRLLKIRFEEILFVEALQNYVAIHTPGKKHITYVTLKTVEEQLPPALFIKIHKSYIIAMQKVDSIEGNEVKIGAHALPVSRNIREEVVGKILKNRLLRR